MMMFRLTQCAAPLASLLLFAAGLAFVGTTAKAAGGFVGNVAEVVPDTAPTATESKTLEAGGQQAMPPGAAPQKCKPTKTAVHC
jgi:hypothetical protein